MTIGITASYMKTCLGDTAESSFDAMMQGKSGVGVASGMARRNYKTRHAYEMPDLKAASLLQDRIVNWLSEAINTVLQESGVLERGLRLQVIVGTGLREHRSLEQHLMDQGDFALEHFNLESALRAHLPEDTSVCVLTNACAASLFALGMGCDALDLDECDAVLVAGVDSLAESMFALLDRVNPVAPVALQAFQKNRLGVLMGEAVAAVMLEKTRKEKKSKDNSVDSVTIRGVGMSTDAHHDTAPDYRGVLAAMKNAYDRSGVSRESIDMVMAHGTGTQLNDSTEGQVLSTLFADLDSQPVISAIKTQLGHTSGASGLVGLITAMACMREGKVPPVVGLDTPIDEVKDLVFSRGENKNIQFAQVNAFGFGGVNAVAILENTKLVGTIENTTQKENAR